MMGNERFTEGEVEKVEPERRVDERRKQVIGEGGHDAGVGGRAYDRRENPPDFVKCPQCESMYCGPIACRFSGIKNK
jgi:hypothetical protein